MTDDAKATFRERLRGLVGKPTGSRRPTVAPDPVNQPMIRHWIEAIRDDNPVYVDPDAANRYGNMVYVRCAAAGGR